MAGESRLRVTGASMLPAIWPGDVIHVEQCAWSDLREGQIVLYRREGRLIAHRIQAVSPEHLITKGDSLASVDEPVEEEAIIGQVASITRGTRAMRAEQTHWQRVISAALSRSDWLTRIALGIHRRLCGAGNLKVSQADPTPAGK